MEGQDQRSNQSKGGSQWVHTPTCPSIFKEDTDIKAVIYLCQLGSDTEFR